MALAVEQFHRVSGDGEYGRVFGFVFESTGAVDNKDERWLGPDNSDELLHKPLLVPQVQVT